MKSRIKMIGAVATIDTRTLKPQPKTADAFYLSREWRRLSNRLTDERGRACEDPEHPVDLPRTGVRVYPDHVVELRDGGAPLDERNVMLRCASCHTRKTAAERVRRYQAPVGPRGSLYPDWIKPSLVPVTIVCGPPASGKTTYVRDRADPRDLVLDLDEIAAGISGLPEHTQAEGLLDAALRERNRRLIRLSERPVRWPGAWLIVGEADAARRQWWCDKLGTAKVVVLKTAEQVCLARIDADPSRAQRRAEQCEAVVRWFNVYLPRAGEAEINSQG